MLSARICFWGEKMDAEYEFDSDGNVVIIGVTANETAELMLLNSIPPFIEATLLPGANDQSAPVRGKRKWQLIDKHLCEPLRRRQPLNLTRH
jgi:hypothetical protein